MNKYITPMEYDSIYGMFCGIVVTTYYFKHGYKVFKAFDIKGFFKGMI